MLPINKPPACIPPCIPPQTIHAWAGIALAGQAIWRGCRIDWQQGELWVQPSFPSAWSWWALLDLPLGHAKLSLLWDGKILHTTQPVRSELPVQVHQQIRALKTEEHEFDLEFELKWANDEAQRQELKRIWQNAEIIPGQMMPSVPSKDRAHKIARIYRFPHYGVE